MSEIRIRDYEPEDAAGLLALVRELQAAEAAVYDRMKPPDQIGQWYLDGLLESCRTHKGRLLVASDGEALLGYAVVLTEMSSEDEPDEVPYRYAYVQDLAVGAGARGRGLGTRLLARCEALAREAGVRWLRVSVLSDNAAAVGVYRKAGFRPLFMDMEKDL